MATKVEDLHDQLTQHIEQIVTGDDWMAMLDVASKFHSYSLRNIMLIEMQRPDATRVAGYKAWQKLGRQVRKGEKAIKILAPCTYRAQNTDDSDNVDAPRTLRGFTVASVFEVEQTEGDELPDIRPSLLRGDEPVGLWDALALEVHDRGFTLERGDTRPANGSTDFGSNVVTIDERLEPAQAAKTLVHELAHISCGHRTRLHEDRSVLEVEAESVAYIVCAAAGLVSDDYSFPYVAKWARGDTQVVTATGTKVIEVASLIIELLSTQRPAELVG